MDERYTRYIENLRRVRALVRPETHAGMKAADLLEERGFRTIYTTTASCTISSHCGPGTLGILFMTETPSA